VKIEADGYFDISNIKKRSARGKIGMGGDDKQAFFVE
jgi:hypothetical protein